MFLYLRYELKYLKIMPLTLATAALIGAGVSAAAGGTQMGIGSAKARKAARDARRAMQKARADEDAWYRDEYYTDEIDRSGAKRMMQRVEQTLTNQANQARGAAAVSGATPGALAAQQAASQQIVADTMSNIAAMDSDRKSRVSQQHQHNLAGFAQGDIDLANQQQAAGSEMVGSGANMLGNAATAAIMSQVGGADSLTKKPTT